MKVPTTAYDALCQTIEFPRATRMAVAIAYRDAMVAGEAIDWRAVNMSIINRWSKAGLIFIKNEAWRMLTPDQRDYMEGR